MTANVRTLIVVAVMAAGVIALRELIPDPTGSARLMALTAVEVAAGALLYFGATWLQWIGAGRPDGAEREAIAIASRLLARLRPAMARRQGPARG